MEHLHPDLHQAVQQPITARVANLTLPAAIGYPVARRAMDRLEDLLVHPQTHRMPNLLLVGNSGSGKTTVADRFLQRHLAYTLPHQSFVRVPVVLIQLPDKPDEKRFYNEMLGRLATPYRIRDTVERKRCQLLQMMSAVQARMLILDGLDNLLASPTAKRQDLLNAIQELTNELEIPIVAIGTKQAFGLLKAAPMLASRFEPQLFPTWCDGQDYRRLLATFERQLPLKKPSFLESDEVSSRILELSGGTLGQIANLLRQATIKAIRSGQECITVQLLDSLV